MKMFKRFGATLLAILMLLSLSIPALAAAPEVGSITVRDGSGAVKASSSYSGFQIVKWNMSRVNGEVIYTDMQLNAAYRETLVAVLGAPLTLASTDAEILKTVSKLNETANAAEIANLAVALSAVQRAADYTATGGVFSSLPYGYYLIIETENKSNDGTVLSKPILVSVPDKSAGTPDVSITVKTSKADVEKAIVLGEGASSTAVKAAEKKLGDIVKFRLTSTIPTYAANATDVVYYITDTLSKGLTFNVGSVVVTKADGTPLPAAAYSVLNPVANPDGSTSLKINFVYSSIKDLGPLTTSYTATLNKDAVIGNSGNPNSATLTYSNKPGTGSGSTTYTTPPKRTLVFTTGIRLTKVDSNSAPLPGATFGIFSDLACENPVGFYTYELVTDASGTHITPVLKDGSASGQIITGNDGIAYFTGLIAGEYFIKELKAPAGYDLLKDVIRLKISVLLPPAVVSGNEQAVWSVDNAGFACEGGIFYGNIVNTKGFQLPATGGIGTTIFTVSGIGLLVLAGALSFLYFKKRRAE